MHTGRVNLEQDSFSEELLCGKCFKSKRTFVKMFCRIRLDERTTMKVENYNKASILVMGF